MLKCLAEIGMRLALDDAETPDIAPEPALASQAETGAQGCTQDHPRGRNGR
jgi:hypothetical protein